MSTVAKPDVLLQARRVYHQNGEAASLLSQLGPSFEVALLPGRFTADDSSHSVVIGENPSVFTPELRGAIEQNSARLIYVLGPGANLPAEAGGTPVFTFLTLPLQQVVVESSLNAAFENLLLARNQAALQLELHSKRAEIDELNEIGIALSTQRDTESLLDLILRKSREITTSIDLVR